MEPQADQGDDDQLLNLGPVSRKWLQQAGITSLLQLKRLGAVEAYKRVRMTSGSKPSANLLYALEGAITGILWSMVPPKRRQELRQEAGLQE